jgi:hypothetical protein
MLLPRQGWVGDEKMALDIVGLIGAILLGVGLVMFLIGMIQLAGGKRNWQRSVAVAGVGAVIAVMGFLLGGAAFLQSLYTGAQPAPSAPGATWKIGFTTGTEYDDTAASPAAGVVTTISADGQSADSFGSRADMNDAGAVMVAKVSVINLNNPEFSGQTFQIISHIGSFPTISDPTTGANYPLIDPSASDPAVADVVWSSSPDAGVQTKADFYVNVPALASETFTATADVNEAAPAAMTIGTVYSVSYSVGPSTLVWNLHPTA